MNNENFDETTIDAIKKLISGMVTKEEVNEYVLDEETGKMKLVKQKIKKNTIPPNTDIVKLIYSKQNKEDEYYGLDEKQLEAEKQKLINQLKEEDDDC